MPLVAVVPKGRYSVWGHDVTSAEVWMDGWMDGPWVAGWGAGVGGMGGNEYFVSMRKK